MIDPSVAALIGAGIGVVGGGVFGLGVTWISSASQRAMLREARREERRAAAYVEILVAVMATRDEAVDMWLGIRFGKPPEVSPVKVHALVSLLGSPTIRLGFDAIRQAWEDWVTWRGSVMEQAQQLPQPQDRAELPYIEKLRQTVADLADAMNDELHPS